MQHFHSIIFQDLEYPSGGREEKPTPEARGSDQRSYPASKVRGGGWQELPDSPMPEARGGGQENQIHVQGALAAWAQEGQEELFHVEGQEGRR